jgi:hypothetical protein
MAREVDRLLAGLADIGSRPNPDHRPRGKVSSSHRVTRRSVAGAPPNDAPTLGESVALWARVFFGMVFGGAMTQWPYLYECGLPLLGYLGAVAMVMITGVGIAVASWRLRSEGPHILALVILFWGIILAAEQVLPRIGYAAEQASWSC